MTDENKAAVTEAGGITAETAKANEGATNATATGDGGKEANTALSTATNGEATATADTAAADTTKTSQPQEEWREKIIKHDEKAGDRLNRFTSIEAVWDSYRELEKKLSSGSHKKELAADATPEQIASWRKDNGIPETPEGYDLKFDNGFVISDTDKPVVDKFLKTMHDKNAPANLTKEALAWYFQNRQDEVKALTAYQEQTTNETLSELRKEWGNDKFERNINTIKTYFGSDDLFNKINSAVLPDGKSLASDKDMVRFLAAKAFAENPYASISTGTGLATGHSIASEIKDIEALMGNRDSKYWKGSEAPVLQARYLELVRAQEAVKTK